MLYPLVESCLPEEVMRAWERSRIQLTSASISSNPNQLTILMSFLRNEVEGEERISMARQGFGIEKEEKGKKAKVKTENICTEVPTAAGLFSGDSSQKKGKGWNENCCAFCGNSHASQDCFAAQGMSLNEKKAILKEKKKCYCCLKKHFPKPCKPKPKCLVCPLSHFTVMCPDLPTHKGTKISKEDTTCCNKEEESDTNLANQTCSPEVLMQTLMVRLLHKGKEIVVRAVLDSGSQRSYIREDAAEAIGYPVQGEERVKHNLFGGSVSKTRVHKKYQIRVSSMDRKYTCTFAVLDEAQICGDLPRVKSGPWMQEVKKLGIPISDFGKDCPEIQLLIGVDVCKKLETGKKYDFDVGPSAVETHLGWTLCGKAPGNSNGDNTLLVTSMFVKDAEIQDLWKLDTIGITDPAESQTREELQQAAMDNFLKTTKTDSEGRYEVALPWISSHGELKSNKFLAEKRLRSATKKIKAEGLKEAYQKIIDTWEEEGVREEVPAEEVSSFGHYLPHRAVLKVNSETTPVRPVFDASAKEKFSPSLNDCLEKGPNLLELIPDVLTRFRLEKIGVMADIKKAFLQISVRPEDRNYLRFLWWEKNCNDVMKEYRHRRVVFGVSSSPFLLGATIILHLERAPTHLQETAKRLKSSFYVDNCVTSLSSQEEVDVFQRDSTEIMSTAKFDLRGWISSQEKDRKSFPVLGLTWDLEEDCLTCDTRGLSPEVDFPVTKRKILSAAHGIFDPIGFSCPVTLFPKKLLQEAWSLKVGWDDELPENISRKFENWKRTLPLLEKVKIPRWLFNSHCDEEKKSLHVFVDASKDAYAACVYMRGETEQGVTVQLILAKARVAPVKAVSIPRLELLACCIGARLAYSVKKILNRLDMSTRYWTDSSNALSWIRKDEQWAVFVANRVKEIRKLSDYNNWEHISGILNPADLPSRGCTPKQLIESAWWEGPTWLKNPENMWPKSKFAPDDEIVNSEKKKTVVAAHLGIPAQDYFTERLLSSPLRNNTYEGILKIVAYIRRFYSNCKKKAIDRKMGQLDVKEIEGAEMSLVYSIQQETFAKEKEVKRGVTLFKDEDGYYKVKTKLQLRDDFQTFKNPIALPPQHPLVKLMIESKHREMSHAGVQTVQCRLREKFWILSAKKTIREVIKTCFRCRRYDARHIETTPASLPMDRVRDAAVFEITGVDLAGPLQLKGGEKTWIVLFTCAVYRAVHLELVTSLSTEAFLQSFRRFVSRRGRPTTVYSDNGTNFVGAVNLFRGLDWKLVEEVAALKKIQWKFIPLTGAWWGGWWERLIQSVKRILRRVLGKASLTYEELLTVLCDAECVLYHRPLTYVSEDVEDLVPLTPSMFLQEVKEAGVADIDVLDGKGLNRRALRQQKIRDDLRKRFRVEYLGMLVGPGNAKKNYESIRPGEIVLIGDDNHKRLDWKLARVMEVYPGHVGVVRVVRLKTASGEVTRPVQRVYPFEVTNDQRKELIKDKPEVTTRFGRKVKTPNRLDI